MSQTILLILIILPIVISMVIMFMFRGSGPSVIAEKFRNKDKMNEE